MEKIGIAGTGTMGTDIAQIAASFDLSVMMYDTEIENCKNSHTVIGGRLDSYVARGRIEKTVAKKILKRIEYSDRIESLKNSDIVIESIPEDKNLKKDLFSKLDKICSSITIFASNTSSISITEIASSTKRPESVVGIHFLYPARATHIVELISGFQTTRETVQAVKIFLKKIQRDFILSKDIPGFTLNRMFAPIINEAVFLLYEGAATAEDIDKIMKSGLRLPMGPLELADFIGLDVVLATIETLHRGYNDPKYRPCPLLKNYVAAGRLGKKSGKGFYIY